LLVLVKHDWAAMSDDENEFEPLPSCAEELVIDKSALSAARSALDQADAILVCAGSFVRRLSLHRLTDD
jgi:hypothetical protein